MARKMYFDARDVPAGVRLGLSGRKLWIFFKALVLSWLVWAVFGYLGWLAADQGGIGSVWRTARLLPLPSGIYWQSWQSIALSCAGLLAVLWLLLSASLRTSRITFEQLRGDDFYSGREAAGFQRKHWRPLAAIPALLVLALLLALGVGALLGLAGRIPTVGPAALALLAVPGWAASLLVVLVALALVASVPLVPAIVATTRGDTFETLFELFSSITSQPWRLLLYGAISLLTRALGLAAFLLFSSLATGFFAMAVGLGGGDNLVGLLPSGLRDLAPAVVGEYSGPVDLLGLAGTADAEPPGTAGLLAAASGTAIALIAASFWLSSCSSAWTVIYLAIRRRKDGEDLLERANAEDLREFEKQYGRREDPGIAGAHGDGSRDARAPGPSSGVNDTRGDEA